MVFTYDPTNKCYSADVDAETALEVGDKSNPSKFKPHLKFKKWNDDANLEVSFKASNGSDTISGNDKVKYLDGNIRLEYYGIDPDEDHPAGAFEFSIIFDAAPSSNEIVLDYKCKKALFHYQPPLTELIGSDGIVTATETEGRNAGGQVIVRRPENVVGSYAVYHESPKNIKNGINQKAGKICHIYRPKVTDAAENSAWCVMSVDEQKKEIKIIVPQSFLDAAIYPVVLDPTFGYTTVGGSEVLFDGAGSVCHIGSGLIFTPSGGHNILTKFSVYGRGAQLNVAAYNISGGLPVNRLAAAITLDSFGEFDQWNDSAAVSQLLINGTTYGMAEGAAIAVYVYGDTGSGNQRSHCPTDLPATWSSDDVSSFLYSWYATYESLDILL